MERTVSRRRSEISSRNALMCEQEKTLSVHQKKATKQVKNKKKPVKVVYITNPMKVKISASGFRALVQELTGQDADVPEPSKFSEIDNGVGEGDGGGDGGQLVAQVPDDAAMKAAKEDHHHALETSPPPASVEKHSYDEVTETSDYSFHGFDNVVEFTTSQMMIENFAGLAPSNLWYEM